MVLYLVFVLWAFLATTVSPLPQNDIAFSPTGTTGNTNYPVDDASVASAAPISPGTDVVINPPDTTEDTDDYLDGGNSQGDTSDLNDQQPTSSNLIASAEPGSHPSCNPDASSQKKRQFLGLDIFNPFKKPKTPDVPPVCKPREEKSPEGTTVDQDQTWKCGNGRSDYCCAIGGATLPDGANYVKRELCLPTPVHDCSQMVWPPIPGIKGEHQCCFTVITAAGDTWPQFQVPWGRRCDLTLKGS